MNFLTPIILTTCHEEAVTRLLLHTTDAEQKGFRYVCIQYTGGTNVVVLAIAMFGQF